jgi:hypothetical protein
MRFTNTGGALPLLPLLGGLTIALWLNYTNSPSAKVFSISSFSATTNNNDTGKISFDIVGGTTTCFNFSGGTTPQAFQRTIPNSWNHYVITFITGGKIIFYLNGVQQADNVDVPSSWGGSDTNSYRFGGNVGLGCTEGAAAAVTGMTFSDWRFYNTVLTPVQIQTIYQSGGYYLASQMSMTGAPLLKLLSAQAQSSAAGLFSLRAVSGVTARAVNVVAGGPFPISGFSSAAVQNANQFTQTLNGYPFTGSYTANCSSYYSASGTEYPWKCFDKTNNDTWWTTSGGSYSSTTGAYTGAVSTTISGSAYSGEWIQIQIPFGILVTSYTIYRANDWPNRYPNTFRLAGSNDGITWTLVDTQTAQASVISKTFTPSAQTTAYSYYRLCVNQINTGDSYLSIGELILNGASPSLAQDFYADRLGNLLMAPVTGQSLSIWLGGATGYVATWYDQSGKGKNATQTIQALRPWITQDASGRYQMDFTSNVGSCWMDLPTGTIPMQTAYTVICHHNTIGNAKGGICGAGGFSTGNANKFRKSDTNPGYINYWWSIDVVTTTGYAPGNVVTFKFAAETSPQAGTTYVYTNGSQIYNLSRSGWVGVGGNEVIGATDPFVDSENMNGQMYSLFLFTSALSDSDRTAVENAS